MNKCTYVFPWSDNTKNRGLPSTPNASKNCIFSQKMQEKQMKIQNEFQNSEQFWETSFVYF